MGWLGTAKRLWIAASTFDTVYGLLVWVGVASIPAGVAALATGAFAALGYLEWVVVGVVAGLTFMANLISGRLYARHVAKGMVASMRREMQSEIEAMKDNQKAEMALEKIDRLSEDGDIKTDLYELKVNLAEVLRNVLERLQAIEDHLGFKR